MKNVFYCLHCKAEYEAKSVDKWGDSSFELDESCPTCGKTGFKKDEEFQAIVTKTVVGVYERSDSKLIVFSDDTCMELSPTIHQTIAVRLT